MAVCFIAQRLIIPQRACYFRRASSAPIGVFILPRSIKISSWYTNENNVNFRERHHRIFSPQRKKAGTPITTGHSGFIVDFSGFHGWGKLLFTSLQFQVFPAPLQIILHFINDTRFNRFVFHHRFHRAFPYDETADSLLF